MGKARKGSEDSSKKRDSRQVVENGPSSGGDRDEKPKKMRSREIIDPAGNEVTDGHDKPDGGKVQLPPDEVLVTKTSQDRATPEVAVCVKTVETEKKTESMIWDLESALHHIVSMGDGCSEPLSKDLWLSFRVGHSGDSSTLERCYRSTQEKSPETFENEESHESDETSRLAEHKSLPREELQAHLANALGDEDNPPFVFALLAEISSSVESSASKSIAAAILISCESYDSMIRVEWIYVDETLEVAALLERRLWLRVCALSVLMSYGLVGEGIPDDRLRQEAESLIS